MKVKLTNLYKQIDNPGGLRTTDVIGQCDRLPVRGKSFFMDAPPLEQGNIRCVATSKVIDIDIEEGIYTFHTETGSVYNLEILEV